MAVELNYNPGLLLVLNNGRYKEKRVHPAALCQCESVTPTTPSLESLPLTIYTTGNQDPKYNQTPTLTQACHSKLIFESA